MTQQYLKFPLPSRRRGGFSFTEILFAVMILGIGFIMVAAVFPVAIKQTEESAEETTGAAEAKGGASYFERIATTNTPITSIPTLFPVTASALVPPNVNGFGKVVQMSGYSGANAVASPSFWQALSGNLILPTDNRYAWVPFYSRGVVNGLPAPYAQITIVAVQCRNTPSFTSADLSTTTGTPNLQGRPLSATFTPGASPLPDTITFSGSATNAVAEGTYVIVADDSATPNQTAPPANTPPFSCNGFVYRVGNFVSGTTWELMPGGDMKNNRYTPTGAAVQVFVVGRGYNNPGGTTPDTTFAGPAMDIGTFSSFIWIR